MWYIGPFTFEVKKVKGQGHDRTKYGQTGRGIDIDDSQSSFV